MPLSYRKVLAPALMELSDGFDPQVGGLHPELFERRNILCLSHARVITCTEHQKENSLGHVLRMDMTGNTGRSNTKLASYGSASCRVAMRPVRPRTRIATLP